MAGNASAKSSGKTQQPYFNTIANNRKARHDFEVLDTVEAGIVLEGSEVKSLRLGKLNFADAYARIYENECWLMGLHINTYEKTTVQVPEPDRRRKLLLSKRELLKLQQKTDRQGLTLVPLEVYFKGRWVKIKLAVCRGKSKGDKRDSLKKDDARREIARAMRTRRKEMD